jgi:hypothetical protein
MAPKTGTNGSPPVERSIINDVAFVGAVQVRVTPGPVAAKLPAAVGAAPGPPVQIELV